MGGVAGDFGEEGGGVSGPGGASTPRGPDNRTELCRQLIDPSSLSALRVDPEFRDLIPPLLSEERAGLERSLSEEGFDAESYGKIIAWDGVIVDGHNRYEICVANGIPFQWREVEFPDRLAAKVWIIGNQLRKRRNLSDADRIELAEMEREMIEADAERRRLEGNAAGGRREGKSGQNFSPVSEPKDERRTSQPT